MSNKEIPKETKPSRPSMPTPPPVRDRYAHVEPTKPADNQPAKPSERSEKK